MSEEIKMGKDFVNDLVKYGLIPNLKYRSIEITAGMNQLTICKAEFIVEKKEGE